MAFTKLRYVAFNDTMILYDMILYYDILVSETLRL